MTTVSVYKKLYPETKKLLKNQKKPVKTGFVKIDHKLIKRLSAREKQFYVALLYYSRGRSISKVMGVGRSAYFKHYKSLQKKGLIIQHKTVSENDNSKIKSNFKIVYLSYLNTGTESYLTVPIQTEDGLDIFDKSFDIESYLTKLLNQKEPVWKDKDQLDLFSCKDHRTFKARKIRQKSQKELKTKLSTTCKKVDCKEINSLNILTKDRRFLKIEYEGGIKQVHFQRTKRGRLKSKNKRTLKGRKVIYFQGKIYVRGIDRIYRELKFKAKSQHKNIKNHPLLNKLGLTSKPVQKGGLDKKKPENCLNFKQTQENLALKKRADNSGFFKPLQKGGLDKINTFETKKPEGFKIPEFKKNDPFKAPIRSGMKIELKKLKAIKALKDWEKNRV